MRRKSELTFLLKSSLSDLIEHSLRFGFQASNNEAEYEALIIGLGVMKSLGPHY